MRRLTCSLILWMAVPCLAICDDDDGDALNIGRYQMTFSVDGLYFLDTATGELWLKGSREEWDRVDSPVKWKPKSIDVPAKTVSLTLTRAGETIPMVQREKRAIPGSSETLWVQLGDITGGQVVVEVIDVNGRQLLKRTSLKNKEFVKFKVDQTDVYLQIVEMVNNLLDDDICQVHLSLRKPKVEQESTESIDAKKDSPGLSRRDPN